MRKNSRSLLKRHWDSRLSRVIKTSFETVEREFFEHGGFVSWFARYIVFPFAIFYVVLGVLLGQNVLASLFISLLVFLYSNFVPDLDTLLTPTKDASRVRSTRFERLALLFFGPLTIYYLLSKEARPVFAGKPKEFHQLGYLLLYCLFLFLVGLVFWPPNNIRSASLAVFGGLGYASHLFVDGYIRLPKF